MTSSFAERRHANRRPAFGEIWWQLPNDDGYRQGWLIEHSPLSTAFLARTQATPVMATRIRISTTNPSTNPGRGREAYVSRIDRIHGDLSLVIARIEAAVP